MRRTPWLPVVAVLLAACSSAAPQATTDPVRPFKAPAAPPRPSPIVGENRATGGSGWQFFHATNNIFAYVDRTSYAPGQTVSVFTAATSPSTAKWELWRTGYYGGSGGRKVASGGPVPVQQQTPPILDSATGMVRAGWPRSFTFDLPADAPTGAYLLKIIAPVGETRAFLVVREATPAAPIVVVIPVNTYQAYNYWGGTSLYTNRRSDWNRWHAYAVSFERPYVNGGDGEFFNQDRDFVMFAEAQGYDMAYATDADLDADPTLLEGRRMVVVEGHNEYWSAPMRDRLEQAIAAGVNVAFLGANDVYWQIRYGPGADGAERRQMIAYKEFASLDPLQATDPGHVTTNWRRAPVSRPENAIIGIMFGDWIKADAPLFVNDPASWFWAGAHVGQHDLIPGLYGDEIDNRHDNGQQPAGLAQFGSGMSEGFGRRVVGHGETTFYTASSGAQIFAAGSLTWSRLLSRRELWDPRIQQATANLFARMAGDGVVPAPVAPMVLPPPPPRPQYRQGVVVTTVTTDLTMPVAVAVAPNGDAIVADDNRIVRVDKTGAVAVVAGGAPGDATGPALSAAFLQPRAVAVGPDSTIYVLDSGNQKVKTIANGTVASLAGSWEGFADGTGSAAQFGGPGGMVLTPSGVLLIADSFNNRIRAVTPSGVVSTYAGTGTAGSLDGPGASATLDHPSALALRPDGSVVFTQPNSGALRVVGADALHTVSTLAGAVGREGWDDGPIGTAALYNTVGLAARGSVDLILCDSATSRVRLFSGGNLFQTLAGGSTGALIDGPGNTAGFTFPKGAAFAPDGSLVVVDAGLHALRRITF